MQKTKVTIYDIAEKAGVSSSTVARAMRGALPHKSKKSQARYERIKAIADELGYKQNWRAKAFSNRRTNAIGLFHVNAQTLCEYTMGLTIGAFTTALTERGYHLVIIPYDSEGNWRVFLEDGRLDGLAVSHFLPEPAVDVLRDSELPVVLIGDRSIAETPSVMIDDEAAAYEATKYLMGQGHERIVFGVHDDVMPHSSVDARQSGYTRAMTEARLPVRCESGESELVALLKPSADRPTALLCYCNLEATAIYHAAWRLGVSIPDELSVVAFNDLPVLAQLSPPLTVVGFDVEAIGREAARLLIESIEGDQSLDTKLVVPHALIERHSVANCTKERS